jgi:hypothetical protein
MHIADPPSATRNASPFTARTPLGHASDAASLFSHTPRDWDGLASWMNLVAQDVASDRGAQSDRKTVPAVDSHDGECERHDLLGTELGNIVNASHQASAARSRGE